MGKALNGSFDVWLLEFGLIMEVAQIDGCATGSECTN
jgi:hypothetical protein